jgi:hypothetical protein
VRLVLIFCTKESNPLVPCFPTLLVTYTAHNYDQHSTEIKNDIVSLKETKHIFFNYRSFLGGTPCYTKELHTVYVFTLPNYDCQSNIFFNCPVMYSSHHFTYYSF